MQEYSNTQCLAPTVTTGTPGKLGDDTYSGPGSRCVQQSALFGRYATKYNRATDRGACYDAGCDGNALYVQIGSTQVALPSGGTVDLSAISGLQFVRGSSLGPDPDNARVCSDGSVYGPALACDKDCSARGRCQAGVCRCIPGAVGGDCSADICWSDAQCNGLICNWSGDCMTAAEIASGRSPPPPPGPQAPVQGVASGPAAAPAQGAFITGAWTNCSAACGRGSQSRTVTCNGSCAGLAAPPTTRPCQLGACAADACAGAPCGRGGTCSWDSTASTIRCTCSAGYSGTFCQLKSGCIMDSSGECCPAGRLLAANGTCCSQGASLDASGACCTGTLDACGVCGGRGTFVDQAGSCCTVGATQAGGLCCYKPIDACGVCGGSGRSCSARFSFQMLLLGATVSLFSDATSTVYLGLIVAIKQQVSQTVALPSSSVNVTLQSNGLGRRRRLQDAGLGVQVQVAQAAANASLLTSATATAVASSSASAADSLASDGVTGANVTGTVAFAAVGVCGNGVCEIGEDIGSPAYCAADCPGSCPLSGRAPAVGLPGKQCAGIGRCLGLQRVCDCGAAYAGTDCSSCAYGYVATAGASGATNYCAPTTSTFAAGSSSSSQWSMKKVVLIVIVIVAVVMGCALLLTALYCLGCICRQPRHEAGVVYQHNPASAYSSELPRHSSAWGWRQPA